jgi:hypothetical protein
MRNRQNLRIQNQSHTDYRILLESQEGINNDWITRIKKFTPFKL